MNDWGKLVEPLPFGTALALFLLSANLLFSPDPLLGRLGMTGKEAYRPWVGLVFLLSLCWMVVGGVVIGFESVLKKHRDNAKRK